MNGAAAVAAAGAGAAERLVAMLRQRAPSQPVRSLLLCAASAPSCPLVHSSVISEHCVQQHSCYAHSCQSSIAEHSVHCIECLLCAFRQVFEDFNFVRVFEACLGYAAVCY